KIDRLACIWLIQTRIDPEAELLFVPGDQVLAVAEREGAMPFHVPGAELAAKGTARTFDAFLAKYGFDDPVLERLALILRGADLGDRQLAPEGAGLRAVSFGLGHVYSDDAEMVAVGLPVYAGLYAWCQRTPDRSQRSAQPRQARTTANLDDARGT